MYIYILVCFKFNSFFNHKVFRTFVQLGSTFVHSSHVTLTFWIPNQSLGDPKRNWDHSLKSARQSIYNSSIYTPSIVHPSIDSPIFAHP